MSSDSKSLSYIVSSYHLDLSKLKLRDERPSDEKSFQESLDELLESYGSHGYPAYILLRNVQIRRATNFDGGYVLYSPLEKIISEKKIEKIFRDSPKLDKIKKSIYKMNKHIKKGKNGELYLPQRLKGNTIVETEIDALVIAREYDYESYDGKMFLYNIEFKSELKKNINDEIYIKALLQVFRSTIVLINALLETGIISNDSEFYTFSIIYSRDWYRTLYLFVYKNRDLYSYYINHKDKSIKYQIPLIGVDMKKYAYYSKDAFEHSMEERGIIPYLLGLGNQENHKKRR